MKHYVQVKKEADWGKDKYLDYYVGETADIKALYKSIRRNKWTNLVPLFVESPKFSENKSVYALCIENDKYVSVVNSDTMLHMIITGEVERVL